MSKYRKRPVVVEAFRWTGDETQEEDPEWIVAAMDLWPETGGVCVQQDEDRGVFLEIETLEGVMRAFPGYWIVRGVEGELCPVRADIFEKTYEKVDETTDAVEILHRRYNADAASADEVDGDSMLDGETTSESDDLTTLLTDMIEALKKCTSTYELRVTIEKFLSAVKAGEEEGDPSVVCDPIIVDGYEEPPEYKEGER